MNRNELKKVVEDNGCRIETNGEWIDFYAGDSKLGYVSEEYKAVFTVYDNCPRALAQVMLDYSYTPLEEREDEKKYYLRFPKGYNSWYNYLAKEINKDNGEYDCSGKCIDNEKYKNIFTQKEIDTMPFDTNFFIKEELK